MTKFIADNWIIIVGVMAVILGCLIVALVLMDRKDKKLIADYKAELKKAKTKQADEQVAVPVESVDVVEEEGEKPVEVEKVEKKTVAKTTAKKSTSTTAKKTTKTTTSKTSAKKPATKKSK